MLTAELTRKTKISYSGPGDADLQTRMSVGLLTAPVTLTTGTGSGQANIAWSDTSTLATGASETIDLAGTLTDVFGTVLTFVKVKSIQITTDPANTTSLTFGNGANPFVGPFGAGTHTLTLPAGASLTLDAPVSGWVVTAGTGDGIKVTNSAGASATYSITIIGTSA
jgi:hypothetical protein